MFYRIGKLICFILFKIFFRLRIFGKENFPKEGGFILAANHASFLDPVVAGICSPRPVIFLAKEELFRNRAFAFLISSFNAVPIKSDFKRGLNVSVLKTALSVLKARKGMAIFPEGQRSKTGEIQEMHAGVGFLAVKSGCPVVPVFIGGTEKALPVKSKVIKFEKIVVYIGKALKPCEISPGKYESFEDFSKRVEQSIRELKNQSLSR